MYRATSGDSHARHASYSHDADPVEYVGRDELETRHAHAFDVPHICGEWESQSSGEGSLWGEKRELVRQGRALKG
jgi:hypothetical protein